VKPITGGVEVAGIPLGDLPVLEVGDQFLVCEVVVETVVQGPALPCAKRGEAFGACYAAAVRVSSLALRAGGGAAR
jgi:hypothetical protein